MNKRASYFNVAQGIKPTLTSVLVILVLLSVNFFTFQEHYLGRAIIPWDFIGGYHFQVFGWIDTPGLNPPSWYSWGDIGFPSSLALQSSQWYLPIYIFKYSNLIYDLKNAASFQALHVFFGSLGCYLFIRVLSFDYKIALAAAVAYHFSSGFYSNQQHVDIVRAYALCPWLLYFFHPQVLMKNIGYAFISTIFLFQFFVVAYPGVIVSSAYILAAYTIAQITKSNFNRYVLTLCVVLVSALLMSGVKWVPFIVSSGLYEAKVYNQAAPYSLGYLLLLFFDYTNNIFFHDVTMRSLYIPSSLLLFVFYIGKIDKEFKIGVIILLAAIIGFLIQSIAPLEVKTKMLLHVSRFPLSDWRSYFHIGLIILSCCGLKNYLNLNNVLQRTFFALFFVLFIAFFGYVMNFDIKSVKDYVVFSFSVLCFYFMFGYGVKRRIYKSFGLTLVVFIVIIQGMFFQKSFGNYVWNLPWNKANEEMIFKYQFHDIYNKEALFTTQRPIRFVVGDTPSEVVKNQNHSYYNNCWYEKSYCLFGYNNLKLSIPHNKIKSYLKSEDNGSEALLYFIKDVQTAKVIPEGEWVDDIVNINNYQNDSSKVLLEYTSYLPGEVKYHIENSVNSIVVENEIWWLGWHVKACGQEGCLNIETKPSNLYLRTWMLPKGKWDITVYYVNDGEVMSYYLFFIAIVIFILYAYMNVRKNDGNS